MVLAPFVGAFADAMPKGQVMFITQQRSRSSAACMMLFGAHPLLAYAVVGLGAAAYSPAKYGILTELLPPSQLVMANGWIEGLTVASIILGVAARRQAGRPRACRDALLALRLPAASTPASTRRREAAIAVIIVVYAIAALFNLRIPRHRRRRCAPMPRNPLRAGAATSAHCNARLWRDKLGQISLADDDAVLGRRRNLRFIVLAWARARARLQPDAGVDRCRAWSRSARASARSLAVALRARCDQRDERDAARHRDGRACVIVHELRHSVWVAAPLLILLGALAGFFVVPMNALLQHRGHNLMGAGRSIAVQNFNENIDPRDARVLLAAARPPGLSITTVIILFGLFVAGTMATVQRWFTLNKVKHATEINRLMEIARSERH